MTNAEIVSALSSPDLRQAGLEALYQVTNTVLQFMCVTSPRFMAQTGPQDFTHDVYLTVVDLIDQGRVSDPSALRSYIWSVAKYTRINRSRKDRFRDTHTFSALVNPSLPGVSPLSVVEDRTVKSPFAQAVENEEQATMREVLAAMPEPKRGIISRFYLQGESKQQICAELGLTPTQFRLHKNRGKAQLTSLCLQRVAGRAAECAA